MMRAQVSTVGSQILSDLTRTVCGNECVREACRRLVSRKVCFDQSSASMGATVTRSFTAWASCASSVMNASAWSWVRATYSA
jgi:hypothetical protein